MRSLLAHSPKNGAFRFVLPSPFTNFASIILPQGPRALYYNKTIPSFLLLMLYRFTSLLLCLILCPLALADNYLFRNGQSDYAIVIAPDASVSEKTAAQELQAYIQQASGVRLPISELARAKMIHVGWTRAVGAKRPADGDEGFRYLVKGDNLYIYGGKDVGTMYGVFAFLENEVGVRWYTPSLTQVPRLQALRLQPLDVSERPAILRRMPMYKEVLSHPEWCAHNRVNDIGKTVDGPYGKLSAYWGIHTFSRLVPPDDFFDAHPEYFALRDGKRIRNGQLCLGQGKALVEVVARRLLEVMREKPGYWCYDVSQNDNELYCQCKRCTRLAKKYGGQSGLMLWFVNQVAERVERAHPEVMIGTFAYQYTRHAPHGIRPRKNVVVRLCNIECCFAHPLEDANCEMNRAFMQDLQAWGSLTDRIYLWDYVADFRTYLTPYPNQNVLAPNIRTFSRHGVMGLLEEGTYDAPWSEFSELRQWLLARLMWNPEADVAALTEEFCRAYYGQAAAEVLAYQQAVQRQVTPTSHMNFQRIGHDQLFTTDFVDHHIAQLERAVARCGNDSATVGRTNRVLASLYLLKIKRNQIRSRQDDTFRKLQRILRDDPTIIQEGGTDLDTYLRKYCGFT